MNAEDNFASFLCPSCNTEIEASPDLIGQETECPACGAKITVPAPQPPAAGKDGVVRHGVCDDDARRTQALKSRTIRIELSDL